MRAIDRVRHEVGHRALAIVFGVGTSVWHRVLKPGFGLPPPEEIANLRRWFGALIAEDRANVEAGDYPRDFALHFEMRDFLRALPEAIADVPRMVRRAKTSAHALPVTDERYPDYYQRAFHWQVDGWLSDHSARIYDAQVEFLFFGTMDMMRRMSLPPVVRALRGQADARLLDIACGTGKLIQHLTRLLPSAEVTGVDLSPHYVRRAQERCAAQPNAHFLAANGEALPLPDGHFDAVTIGFLFHELPGDARRQVLAEAARVLKPGGLLVFQDAAQHGDRNSDELGFYLDWFPRVYHEPYFKGYVRDPVEALCRDAGFDVQSSEPKLLSKVVVARR